MKNYEIMFIVRPTLSEEEVKKVVKDFSEIIAKNGGKVTKEENMGQRELAYEIKDYKKGYYVVVDTTCSGADIAEFERLSNINASVLRHLTLRR